MRRNLKAEARQIFEAGLKAVDPLEAVKRFVEPKEFLEHNDSYNFFRHLDDLLITGPTNTNVMDIRIILVK